MADSGQTTQVDSAAEAAPERAEPGAVPTDAAPELGDRLAALAATGLRPGRGGHAALARQALALQRRAGNAATARILARQNGADEDHGEFRWSFAPDGPAADAAAWLFRFVPGRMSKGTHVVAVTTGDQLELFTASAQPAKLGSTFKLATKRPEGGVWAGDKDGPFQGPLGTKFNPRSDFMYAGVTGVWVQKVVNEVDELAWRNLLPGFPGEVWLCVREGPPGGSNGGRPGPPAPTPTPKPGPRWAEDQVRKAQSHLDGTKTTDRRERPERLVPWQREDGKWFVNVWRKGDVRALELDPNEDTKALEDRILKATQEMKADDDPARSVRVQGGATGRPRIDQTLKPGEFSPPTGAPFDPTSGLTPNSPPYPARLISYGPEGTAGNEDYEWTVNGATVAFEMDLDFHAVAKNFWQEFGAYFQSIAYRWELFDISKLRLDQIKGALGRPDEAIQADIERLRTKLQGTLSDEDRKTADAELTRLQDEVTKRGKDPDSGLVRNMGRDVANTWEDTKADLSSPAVLIPGYVALVAVSDLVQLVGAPISAFFSLLTTPASQRSIGFSEEGLFLLRCFAQPVIGPSDVKRIEARGDKPIIRPPSVAYLAVKVTPINKRAQEVNDAELTQLDDLRRQLDAPPPPFDRTDVEERIKVAEASLEDNNIEAIDRAIARNRAELAKVEAWRKAEHENAPLDTRGYELRAWKAMLDLGQTSFADYEQRINNDIAQLNKMRARVATYGLDGTTGRIFRARMTLASEVDGRVYPLVCHLVEDSDSRAGDRKWRVVDTSADSTKGVYVGTGSTHNAAILDAIDTFKSKCDYGRGTIAVRLPLAQLKAATGEDIVVPGIWRSAPGIGKRFFQRLKDLALAAEIAALVISGPIGIGIGIVGGLAAATVAIHDLAERSSKGQSLISFEGAMDVLAIVGAVAMMGGAAARVKGIANLSARGRWVGDKLHVVGMGLMRGQVIVIPASLYVEIAAIEKQEQAELAAAEQQGTTKHVNRAKYRALRLEALARAIKSGAVTVRMMKMAENPELGWNPLKGKAPATPPPTPDPDPAATALKGKLQELATLLKKRGATNAERQQVIEALRTPTAAARGPLEGFVPRSLLAENQAAVRSVRARVKASNPDVIVGMERGGSFLADVLAAGDADLAPKVRKITPVKPDPAAATKSKFAPEMADAFTALADAGAKKIAIVDYYMGGRTASDLSALLRKRFATDPKYAGVTVEVYWIRETFGFEKTSAAGPVLDPLRGNVSPQAQGGKIYSQTAENVSLALGDDMQSVLTPGSKSPISVFDEAGNIIKTVHPTGTQTTRDVMIELINGPAQ